MNASCGDDKIAYTFDSPGRFWTAHYIVLCDYFFAKDKMVSLADMTRNAQYDMDLQKTMDNWRDVRAMAMFHETYHWGRTVSDPRCLLDPERYSPSEVVDLAKGDINISKLNAESWAMAAVAIYIQKTFGRDTPPGPQAGVDGGGNSKSVFKTTALDQPPDWFDAPAKLDAPEFKPPPSSDLVQLGSLGTLNGNIKS